MLEEALATLAMTGATTVVAAMATNAWDTTRTRMSRLFHRAPAQQVAIDAQLDNNNTLVEQAVNAERVRHGLVAAWQVQLEALLEQHPDAASELQALVHEVRSSLPQAQQHWVQHITAQGQGSHAYGSVGGNVNVYHANPKQVEPPAPGHDIGASDTH